MACDKCGGTHGDDAGACGNKSNDDPAALMGFLSDFRSANLAGNAPPTAAPASTPTPAPTATPAPPAPPPAPPPPPGYGYTPPPGPYPPAAPWPGGWPPGPPAPTSKRRTRVVIALAAAVALAGAGLAVALTRPGSGPHYPSAWDPRVAPIAAFVAQDRGLAWKHAVAVNFLPAAQFEATINRQNGPPPSAADQADMLDALRAVGVVSGRPDLEQASQSFADSDVVGLYVDSVKTVYVKGSQLTPYVRVTLAHELTHALQDQYFNLNRMKSGHADDDEAVTALIEGDAVRVQDDYESQLPASDQTLYDQEQSSVSGSARNANTRSSIPPFLIDQSTFPYDFGPTFVAALVSEGGNRQVDDAFRNPPTLDGQILDPASYVPGAPVPSVTVPTPPAGAKVINSGGFGEVPLFQMLADEVGFAPAQAATSGWTADASVVYRDRGTVCVDISVLADSPVDAATLGRAGAAWASRLPGATTRVAGKSVYFHSCDPGPDWKPAPAAAEDPYQYLAAGSVVLYQLITAGHLSLPTASCATGAISRAMGPKDLAAALQTNDPSSPLATELERQVAVAVRACL